MGYLKNINFQFILLKRENKIDFLLMGAKKSGTTWLSSVLGQSDELSFIHFIVNSEFSPSTIEIAINNNKDSSLKKISKMNMKVNSEFAEIYKLHNSNLKIAVLLRNPITRTFSNFIHYINKETRLDWNYYNNQFHLFHPIKSLIHPAAINKNQNTILFDINIDIEKRRQDYIDKVPEWTKKSFYYELLEPYFNVFKSENIQFFRYEEISKNPNKLIEEITDFLGLKINNKMIDLSKKVINSSKREKSIKQLLKIIPSKEFVGLSESSIGFLNELYLNDVEKLSNHLNSDFVNYWQLDKHK